MGQKGNTMSAAMADRRQFQTSKYVAAFAMTTLIFIAGMLLGNYVSEKKLSTISDLQQHLAKRTISSELQYLLVAEHPCQSINSSQLTEELFDIATRLDFMESSLGKKNKDVIKLKEYYSLLEIRHWLFLKKARSECSLDYELILYFYSNRGDCGSCEQQGFVLNTLHEKYPYLNIYSFDINIEDPALDAIKEIYEVNDAPTLVVNNETLHGFIDKAALEGLLGRTRNQTAEITSPS